MVRFKCSESSSVQLRLRTAGLIQISHLTHPQTKCEKAKFLAQKPNKFEAGMGRKAWDRTEVLVSFLLLLQNILTKSNTERERFTWLKLPGRSPYCREGNKEPKAPCSQWSTESEMDSWVHLHSLARPLALTQLPPVSLPREYYSTANSSLGLLSSVLSEDSLLLASGDREFLQLSPR